MVLWVDRLYPIIEFIIFSSFRIPLFSVGFYFDSTLIVWALTVKLCMAVGARHVVFGLYILSCAGSDVRR
jgi:hypothetical protein